MAGICEGRVVIVSGAGRGLGRAHALEFARQGARVVVNDLGAELDGTGSPTGPAGEVVDEIRRMGGEAIANGDDISEWNGAKRRHRRTALIRPIPPMFRRWSCGWRARTPGTSRAASSTCGAA